MMTLDNGRAQTRRSRMASKPIVAATDGSEESLQAVAWAASEASLRGAPLRIGSAAPLPPRLMTPHTRGSQHDALIDRLVENADRALAVAAVRAAHARARVV